MDDQRLEELTALRDEYVEGLARVDALIEKRSLVQVAVADPQAPIPCVGAS